MIPVFFTEQTFHKQGVQIEFDPSGTMFQSEFRAAGLRVRIQRDGTRKELGSAFPGLEKTAAEPFVAVIIRRIGETKPYSGFRIVQIACQPGFETESSGQHFCPVWFQIESKCGECDRGFAVFRKSEDKASVFDDGIGPRIQVQNFRLERSCCGEQGKRKKGGAQKKQFHVRIPQRSISWMTASANRLSFRS